MTVQILTGDALERLKGLADESVQCCVTSPPYYGLRDYGTATWAGGDPGCDHLGPPKRTQAGFNERYFDRPAAETDKQSDLRTPFRDNCPKCGAVRKDDGIGLEATPEAHIAALVEVFAELRRVLRRDGCLWLNYGDAYASQPAGSYETAPADGGGYRTNKPFSTIGHGAKPKDLLMLPARAALALQQDGWWLRSMLPWVKRSAMPESASDRPATAIEYVFLLTKSARYYFDMEAVRVQSEWGGQTKKPDGWATHGGGHGSFHKDGRERGEKAEVNGGSRNFRNSDLFYASLEPSHGLISAEDPLALDVNPAGFAEAHFATFPPKLIEPLIKAATSEKGCCPACAAPWVREVETKLVKQYECRHGGKAARGGPSGMVDLSETWSPGNNQTKTRGWSPSCGCNEPNVHQCTILDPFGGAGTTGLVADRLGRDCILIELNPDYAEMARKRIHSDAPLLAEVKA